MGRRARGTIILRQTLPTSLELERLKLSEAVSARAVGNNEKTDTGREISGGFGEGESKRLHGWFLPFTIFDQTPP